MLKKNITGGFTWKGSHFVYKFMTKINIIVSVF